MGEGAKIYREAFWLGMLPERKLSVSEWADQNRILSTVGSAEPGPWRTARTPYLKDIMDALGPDSPIEEIVVMKGAQIGYSEALVNFLGYVIDAASAPTLVVQPTVELAKRFSKQRVDPLIDFCQVLSDKVSDPRSRDSGNTVLAKEFPGGILVLTGANSAVGLRMMPARFLLMDEVDAYPDDADGEGDPMLLAAARTRTFSRRKIVKGSTPKSEHRSKIKRAFDATDQRYFHVPCPFCDQYQKIVWGRIKWPKGEPEKAALECEGCKKLIEEHWKDQMLGRGVWIADNPAHKNPKVVGFHISSLYSPFGWYSWAEAAREWIASKGIPERLRGFVNTVLGETWKQPGEAPDWKRLYDLRETYDMGRIPEKGLLLVAGADVQKDRIEVELVAYGYRKESWSIDYLTFYGDTSQETGSAWQQLDALMGESFPHASGHQLPIRMLAVDSGYNTNTVYNWCRKYPISRVIATKGSDLMPILVGNASPVDVTVRGQTIRRGFKVWSVGVNLAKSELYSWLQNEKPIDGEAYPPGYCHFPQYGEEFFKMLTAEQLVEKMMRGYKKHQWEKTRERNEALDARILARVAASVMGMDRMRDEHWEQLAASLGGSLAAKVPAAQPEGEAPKVPEPAPPAAPTPPPRRKSQWLDGW